MRASSFCFLNLSCFAYCATTLECEIYSTDFFVSPEQASGQHKLLQNAPLLILWSCHVPECVLAKMILALLPLPGWCRHNDSSFTEYIVARECALS